MLNPKNFYFAGKKKILISQLFILQIITIDISYGTEGKPSIPEQPWEKPKVEAMAELTPFSIEEVIDLSTKTLISEIGFGVCDRHDRNCLKRLDFFNSSFFPVTKDFEGCIYAGFAGTSGEPGKIEKTLRNMWSILHDSNPNKGSTEGFENAIQSDDADFEKSVGRSCSREQYEIYKKITRDAYTAARPLVASQIAIAEMKKSEKREVEARELASKQKVARQTSECQKLKRGFSSIKIVEGRRGLLPNELALKANLQIASEIINCGNLDEAW